MPESIDIFCHWLPKAYAAAALKEAKGRLFMLERAANFPVMADLEARFRVMDLFPGYAQVPSLASPPLEMIAGPEASPRLARIGNDEAAAMAEIHPARFPGFVASLPMNNPEAAITEGERAIRKLGALGVQIFTHVNERPLDDPEFLPVIEHIAGLGKPIWLHPARGMKHPDYLTEAVSRYELWWVLGWPYETSAAMGRLIFSGLFDRFPKCVVITHHAGGMIPMMEGRLGPGLHNFGNRNPPEYAFAADTPLKEKPLPAFRRFYADTATFGSRTAIECGLAFFGLEKMLFASDMPFDPEGGAGYIRTTLEAIEKMNLTPLERRRILAGNARRVLGLKED